MFTRERSLRWKDERVGLYAPNRCKDELATELAWRIGSINRRCLFPSRKSLVWQPVERHWSLSLGDWINRNRGPLCKTGGWRPRFEELILPFLNDTRVWRKFDIHWSPLCFYHYGSVTVVAFGFQVVFTTPQIYRICTTYTLVSWIPSTSMFFPMREFVHTWGSSAYSYIYREDVIPDYMNRPSSVLFQTTRVLDKDGNHSWKNRPKPRFGNCPDMRPHITFYYKNVYMARKEHLNVYKTQKNVYCAPLYEPAWRFNLSKVNYKRIRLRDELGKAVLNGDNRKRRRIEKELALTLPILVE